MPDLRNTEIRDFDVPRGDRLYHIALGFGQWGGVRYNIFIIDGDYVKRILHGEGCSDVRTAYHDAMSDLRYLARNQRAA